MSNKKQSQQEIERRFITHEVRVGKNEDNEVREIEGMASSYNVFYDMGWYLERILPGAMEDADLADSKCLLNHDPSAILGATSSSTLEITEDEKGIHYKSNLPDTTLAKDAFTLIERGDIDKSSFGFRIKKQAWVTMDRSELKDKIAEDVLDRISYGGKVDVRDIVSFSKIYDVSPVTFPANNDTSVAKRSHEAYIKERDKPNTEPENTESRAFDKYDAQYMFNQNNQ